MSEDHELVVLAGTPAEVGAAYGRATVARTRRYLEDFFAGVDRSDVSRDELRRRTERYQAMVDQLAPWWNDEMVAIARASELEPEAYLAYVAQKYVIPTTRSAAPPHECTSFLSIGRASLNGESLLHKNRDSYPRAQGVWIRAIDGCHRYLGGGDVGDHGVIQFVNERGLAGAMNAGSPNADSVSEGMPTPQILKLVAERAADCQEALEIVRDVVGRGWYTNGSSGSIWLFADRRRGLIVENTRGSLDHCWVENDACARANDFFLPATARWARPESDREPRYLAAREEVRASSGHVSVRTLHRLSRDTSTSPRPICGHTTLSGFTAVIRDDAPLMAWVALGRPTQAMYIPVYLGARGLPRFVMDDTLWNRSVSTRADGSRYHADREPFEDQAVAECRDMERRVAALLAHGGDDEVAEAMTTSVARWSERALVTPSSA